MENNGWGSHGSTAGGTGSFQAGSNPVLADKTNVNHTGNSNHNGNIKPNGNNQSEISTAAMSTEPGHWGEATPYDYEGLNSRDNTTWDGNARVYEWDGEMGDVGPEYPELEIVLFGQPGEREHHGIDFTKLDDP